MGHFLADSPGLLPACSRSAEPIGGPIKRSPVVPGRNQGAARARDPSTSANLAAPGRARRSSSGTRAIDGCSGASRKVWADQMNKLLLTACVVSAAGDAAAVAKYTSTSGTCAQIQASLENDGAAIIRYRSERTGLPLSDRFVRDRSFCGYNQTAEQTYIPSADTRSCPVNRCVEWVIPEPH